MMQSVANRRWGLVTALLDLIIIVVFLDLPGNEQPL